MKMDSEVYDCKCYCNDDEDGDSKKKKKEEKDTSPVTVVLKIDMHCEGCIMRIIRSARSLPGVETVRADPVSNKLTLIGFMDPVKTTQKLQEKTKKKIELVSPKPKKETKANNDSKADKPKTTTVAVTTVSLKLNCSCEGCSKRIRKTISKTKGVYDVKMDKEKEMVTVTGTMEVKNVTENLRIKLKKTVKVVPEKKNKNKDKDKEKENAEGITKVGPQGLPCYGFYPGFGPHGFIEGPRTEFFSEEDQNFCCVM